MFYNQLTNPLHASRDTLHDMARKKNKNMQNEPNLKNDQIDITTCNINSYGNLITFSRSKNEPKRTQNEPNFSSKLGSFFQKLALFVLPECGKRGLNKLLVSVYNTEKQVILRWAKQKQKTILSRRLNR